MNTKNDNETVAVLDRGDSTTKCSQNYQSAGGAYYRIMHLHPTLCTGEVYRVRIFAA